MNPYNILIADDEENIRLPSQEILEEEGYTIHLAKNGIETLDSLRNNNIDLLLLDLRMPGIDGIDIMRKIYKKKNAPEVIVITGQGTIQDAVQATKLGAYDFLEKPLQPERILITVKNCLKQRSLSQENIKLRDMLNGSIELYDNSLCMKELDKKIKKIAATNCRVMINGETGSGKELVAKRIHRESNRSDGPFIEVNCSAIPKELIESELFGHIKGSFTGAYQDKKGKFEQAHNGTIFLDEVGDMDLRAQAKVLRVLENGEVTRVGSVVTKKVDIRVISASNKNLKEEIEKGNFREDLYFRLDVANLTVPPLRERKQDIPLLAEYFMKYFSQKDNTFPKKLSEESLQKLSEYHWPGNVRELKNLIEKLVVMSSSEVIDLWELDMIWEKEKRSINKNPSWQNLKSYKKAKHYFEREYLIQALKRNKGNIQKTAKEIGINRSHLHEKIRSLEIDPAFK